MHRMHGTPVAWRDMVSIERLHSQGLHGIRDVMRSRIGVIWSCIIVSVLAGCSTSKPGAPASAAGASSEGTGGLGGGGGGGGTSAADASPFGTGGMGGGGGDAAVSGCGASTIASGTFNFTFDNVQYSYVVHLSPSYSGNEPAPLVLNWHAYPHTGSQEESYTNMDPVADANGWVMVYPTSPGDGWNAGSCCSSTDAGMDRDDIGFAVALVNQIQSAACIDPKRIYTTGFSNGAFMSYALGCEHAELFAAIAPVGGKVAVPSCQPSRSVPLLAFHGTGDPIVDYNADGTLPSVPDTVKAWATRDNCTVGPDPTYQGTVTCQTWSSCDAGATVTLCTAEGEGHCWPGSPVTCGTTGGVGTGTNDIDATAQIAAFFTKFSLP
jgi:polyhydroxybutyrate depolymerase